MLKIKSSTKAWWVVFLGVVVVLSVHSTSKLNQFFLHFSLYLLLVSTISGKGIARDWWWVLAFAFVGSYFEIYNHAHKAITDMMGLDIYRPQDGALAVGVTIIALFWAALALRKISLTPFRVGSAIIAHAAFFFWVFVHLSMVFPIVDELSDRHIDRLKAELVSPFYYYQCDGNKDSGGAVEESMPVVWTCANGVTEDGIPGQISEIAGVKEIHEHAKGQDDPVINVWVSNWEGKRNIDTPLKYVAYFEHDGRYRVIVDWSQHKIDRGVSIEVSGMFFRAFGFIWVVIGSGLLQMHLWRLSKRGFNGS